MRRRTDTFARRFALPAALLVLPMSAGCAINKDVQEGVDPAQLNDDFFLTYLADEPYVSVDEAYRSMLILADGACTATTYEERAAELERRDIARAAWKLQPQQVIDRGSVCYMVCKILKYKGGINRILLGSWGLGDRRYAHRELAYRGIIEYGGMDYAPMTGAEFTTVLFRAGEAMEKRGLVETDTLDIGKEPTPGEPLYKNADRPGTDVDITGNEGIFSDDESGDD